MNYKIAELQEKNSCGHFGEIVCNLQEMQAGRDNGAMEQLPQDNLNECADLDGYWENFYALFVFVIEGVNYALDVDI